MLSELSAWVHSACAFPDVRSSVLAEAREGGQSRLNCHFVIGRNLTRSRRAYLVHSYGGEVFVFELTDDQEHALDAKESMVVATEDGPCQSLGEDAPIHLEDAEFDQSGWVDSFAPITGRYTCSTQLHSFEGVCLRLALSP